MTRRSGDRAAPPALSGQQIAKAAGVSPAIVSRILNLAGLSRLRELERPEPVRRYDASIPASSSTSAASVASGIHPHHANEKAKSAVAFPKAAIAYYNSLGVTTPPSEPESSSPGPTPIIGTGLTKPKAIRQSASSDSPRTTC